MKTDLWITLILFTFIGISDAQEKKLLEPNTSIPIKIINEVSSDDTLRVRAVIATDIKDANSNRILSANMPVRVITTKTASDKGGKGGIIVLKFECTTANGGSPVKIPVLIL